MRTYDGCHPTAQNSLDVGLAPAAGEAAAAPRHAPPADHAGHRGRDGRARVGRALAAKLAGTLHSRAHALDHLGSARRVHQGRDVGIQPLLHDPYRQLCPACAPPWQRHLLHLF